MNTWTFVVLYAATVSGISSIYAPQPLLPILADAFGVSEATASLVTTATMLPLGLAPLAYGFFLDAVPAKPLIGVSLALLACCTAGLCLAPDFGWFLTIRFAQGLLVPALLTSLMTYLATSASAASLRRVMAAYIAVTVFGGFFGRFFAGLSANSLGWKIPFFGLAVVLALCAAACRFLPPDGRAAFSPIRLEYAPQVLRKNGFIATYLVVSLLFFVFSGMLNLLPFRLGKLAGGYSPLRAGAMYAGYLMGILACLTSHRFSRSFGGPTRTMAVGAVIVIAAAAVFSLPYQAAIFASVFVLCAGMFLAHSVAPGVLNSAENEHKGLVNGLYISFYYSGGALGAYLPGLVLARFGERAADGLLLCAAVLAAVIAARLDGKAFSSEAKAG